MICITFLACGENSKLHSNKEEDHQVLRTYHSNGNIATETSTLDDVKDGLYREWFPNGNLQVEIEYQKGEVVTEKLLTLEGEIIKNIVIKDGRKYGLLFSSFCVNGVAKNPANDSLIFETKKQ